MSVRTLTSLAILILALCPGAWTQSNEPVLLPLTERGKGAPTRADLKKKIILTNIQANEPWDAPVKFLATSGYGQVVRVRPWQPKAILRALRKHQPGIVVGVFKPEDIDVNSHFQLLELGSKLDKDPFLDFVFGYVTGATPEEALRFAQNAVAKKRKKLERSILEFGPSSRPHPLTGFTPHKWAKSFQTRKWHHEKDKKDVAATLGKMKLRGILSASGHGMPDGVDHGMKGKELRDGVLDLSKVLYFSGPCYCGVVNRWYQPESGKMVTRQVQSSESFLLGLIRSRVVGAFAGLDPDRGETNHHEREHVLHGATLGEASKATYDDVVMAKRRADWSLLRYEADKARPQKNVGQTMIAGGACRALFGLPDYAPYKKSAPNPFEVKLKKTKKGLLLDWAGDSTIGKHWLCVDVFNGDGGWTHRLRFRTEVTLKQAKRLKSLKILEVSRDGKPLKVKNPTAALELFGERAYLHVTVAFPVNGNERALFGGEQYRARLLLH